MTIDFGRLHSETVMREHKERRERQCILLAFLEGLRSDGSWCEEDYLVCAVYLLRELLEVPLSYHYFLDMCVASSEDCLNDLGGMATEKLISTEFRNDQPRLGLIPGERSPQLRRRYRAEMERFSEEIHFLAPRIQAMKSGELADLSVALFVSRQRCSPDASQEERARRIATIKPHLDYSEALAAVRAIDALAEECRRFLHARRAECPTPVA